MRVSHGNKTSDARPAPPRAGRADATPVPFEPPRPRRPRKTTTTASADTIKTALAVARAALEKKASNVEIIDLVGKADYTDYLVLMSGSSDRHVRALADEIQEQLRKARVRPLSVEGITAGSWILIDYGDVVVHVFQEATRAVYDLDGLWLDAARVPVDAAQEQHA